jgi:hypothetical protein
MIDRKELIKRSIDKGVPSSRVAMRLLVLSPTAAFEGAEEDEFHIIEEVAEFLDVSVRAIHSCGSAKLGFSPTKNSDFVRGESDLDLAIIDADCFTRCISEVIIATNQYRDRAGFAEGHYRSFTAYLAKGIFRPDFMPNCSHKSDWVRFFDELSRKHQAVFEKITAAVYLSDDAFNMKQSESLDSFVRNYL